MAYQTVSGKVTKDLKGCLNFIIIMGTFKNGCHVPYFCRAENTLLKSVIKKTGKFLLRELLCNRLKNYVSFRTNIVKLIYSGFLFLIWVNSVHSNVINHIHSRLTEQVCLEFASITRLPSACLSRFLLLSLAIFSRGQPQISNDWINLTNGCDTER